MGFPEPLNMRPSISSETGVFKTYKISRSDTELNDENSEFH